MNLLNSRMESAGTGWSFRPGKTHRKKSACVWFNYFLALRVINRIDPLAFCYLLRLAVRSSIKLSERGGSASPLGAKDP